MTHRSIVRSLSASALLLAACGRDGGSVPGADPSSSPADGGAAVGDGAAAPATPLQAWARAYPGDVQIDGIASNANGEVFAAGYFVGQATFDEAHVLESARDVSGKSTKDIYVTKHERGGDLAWVRHFGGAGLEGNVYDLVAGPGGIVYASGAFSGSVDFDGRVLTATVEGGAGSASSGTYGNMFLAALDGAGKVQWVQQGTGTVVSGGNEVATDPSGAILQVGIFGGTKEPGGATRVGARELAFDGGYYDSYVAKLTKAGDVAWVAPIGGAGAQRGKAIASDKDGNVLVAGDARDGATRFATGQSFTTTGDAQQDFWVAKYTPEGALVWFRSFGSEGINEVKGIGADPSGNVIVAASFDGESIAVGDRVARSKSPGKNTGLVFALTPDGTSTVWTNTIAFVTKCCELEVDARGHVFTSTSGVGPQVAYDRGGSFTVGGSPRGALLTELDPTGAHIGSRTVAAEGAELGELTLLGDGFVAAAGSFQGASLRLGDIDVPGGKGRTQVVLVLGP